MAFQKAMIVAVMVVAFSAVDKLPTTAAYTPSPAPSGSTRGPTVRFAPEIGGQRILPNGTTVTSGEQFPTQLCPSNTYPIEITLTADAATQILSGISFRCNDADSTIVSQSAATNGPQTTTSAAVSPGTRGFNRVSGFTPYNADDEATPFFTSITFSSLDGTTVSAGNNDTSGYTNPGPFSSELTLILGFAGRKSQYFDSLAFAYTNP